MLADGALEEDHSVLDVAAASIIGDILSFRSHLVGVAVRQRLSLLQYSALLAD